MSPRYDLTPNGEPYEVESTGYALVKWGGIIGSMAAVGLVAFIGGVPILGGGGSGGVIRAPVTVQAGGGSDTLYTNEPAGFTTVAQTDWDANYTTDGFRLTAYNSNDSIATFADIANIGGQPTPPRGGSDVLLATLTSGVGPGADHILGGIESPGTDTTFVGFYSMFDSAYVNCSFQNKFFYFWLDGVNNAGNPWGWFWLDLHPTFGGATGSGDVDWALRFQSNDGVWVDAAGDPLAQLHTQNQPDSTVVNYAQWDKVEILYEPPSAPGSVHDGLVTVWHQGTKIIEVVFGLSTSSAGGGLGGTGKGIDFISTYGGGCTPASDMYFYVAHQYVSAP